MKADDPNKSSNNRGGGFVDEVDQEAPEESGKVVAPVEPPELEKPPSDDDFEDLTSPLPEDVFSLLYVCKPCGFTCIYCILVFMVQASIIFLIMADLLKNGTAHNPLSVPPGVNVEVTLAQAVSMLLAVSTQTNLLTAISRMSLGQSYDHAYVLTMNPNATHADYWISTILQMFVGLAMLVDSFILNMQSTSVLTLMLNFAALAFISEVQQTFFWIAKNGYISRTVEEDTRLVTNFQIPRHFHKASNPYLPYLKRVLFGLITGLLLFFYGMLAQQQMSGKFICNQLVAQFGDEIRPDLAFYSGIFLQKEGELYNGRAVYEDAKKKGAYFAYCKEEQAWTFSGLVDLGEAKLVNGTATAQATSMNACNYWAKSQATATYDIIESYQQPWLVRDYLANQTNQVDHFVLACNDCEGNRASQDCSGHGTCDNNQCVCNEGRIGVNCEYPIPCPRLALDTRTEPLPYAEGGLFVPPTDYELLTYGNDSIPILVYNKPVYFARLGKSGVPVTVIMFTGRRWGLFLNLEFYDANELQQLKENLHTYLPVDFHTFYSTHKVYFFTDPMDLGSPSDGASPVDLQWYHSRKLLNLGTRSLYRVDHNQPTNTVFLCPVCQPVVNNCLNGGTCVTPEFDESNLIEYLTVEGTCNCTDGFVGEMCERQQNCYEEMAQCYNGGNCTISTGSCSCPFPHAGKLCQYRMSDEFIGVYTQSLVDSGQISEENAIEALNLTIGPQS
ncbi:Neurogenic locus notch homolog protein 4 [Seminavis robusta]|uniref:Neurogenic locus notch homolog protein 4 n=1 Tax=Seminavis robusta TaxID=568900 RepID=A0A9N8E9W0_9STRA|nr:Neurogenic locus notch homolog protein 4 [Seminavis robusta]|eukprot:Sro859_g212000.1 Neurogenic locus notch homolog protein 4 (728) ;mRNA; r:24309-26591